MTCFSFSWLRAGRQGIDGKKIPQTPISKGQRFARHGDYLTKTTPLAAQTVTSFKDSEDYQNADNNKPADRY
jgi:hypothetical protein